MDLFNESSLQIMKTLGSDNPFNETDLKNQSPHVKRARKSSLLSTPSHLLMFRDKLVPETPPSLEKGLRKRLFDQEDGDGERVSPNRMEERRSKAQKMEKDGADKENSQRSEKGHRNACEVETFKGSSWVVSPQREGLSTLSLNSPRTNNGTPSRRQKTAHMQATKMSILQLSSKELSQQKTHTPVRKPTVPQKIPLSFLTEQTQRKPALRQGELARIQQKMTDEQLGAQVADPGVVGYEVYSRATEVICRERSSSVASPTAKITPRKRSETSPGRSLRSRQNNDAEADEGPPSPSLRLKPSPQKHLRLIPSPIKPPSFSRSVSTKLPVVKQLGPKEARALVRRLLRDPTEQTGGDVVDTLRAVGVQKGFQTNELRCLAYARLLGVKLPEDCIHLGLVKPHRDWHQVEIDFVRTVTLNTSSLPSWLTGGDSQQQQLRRVMHACLYRNPQLHYFQGYGDICATILAICGEAKAFAIVNELSRKHLKDLLRENFDMVQEKLNLINKLISLTDAETFQFMQQADAAPSFALVWLLTWFARVPAEFGEIARLTDFIISSDTVYMPVYMSAVAVLLKKKEILAGPCEMASVFSAILREPKVSTELLVSKSWDLYCRLPVQTLLQFTSQW